MDALDTRIGHNFFTALLRVFPHDVRLERGLRMVDVTKLLYTVAWDEGFPTDTLIVLSNLWIKGRCDLDKEFKQPTPSGAAELVWNILDFQKDQDIRLKVGYEIVDKIPYVQSAKISKEKSGESDSLCSHVGL
ncbi:putative outer envelope pore protein [Tanacetum coccineum]